jgi:hypothetical protein
VESTLEFVQEVQKSGSPKQAATSQDVAVPEVFSRNTKRQENSAVDLPRKLLFDDDAHLLNIPGIYKEKKRPRTRDVGVHVNKRHPHPQPQPAPRQQNHDFDLGDIDFYFSSENVATHCNNRYVPQIGNKFQ